MKSIALILLVIGVSSAYFLEKRTLSDEDYDTIISDMRIISCKLAVSACTEQIDEIIGNKCPAASKAVTCIKKALVSGSCNRLAAPDKGNFKRSFAMFSGLYQAICIEHIDASDANKACLFTDRTLKVLNKCSESWHESGDVCQIDEATKLSCLAPAFDACGSDVRGVAKNIVELDREVACKDDRIQS